MPAVQTDRIEKQIVLRAPRSRVWRALTTTAEFNQWFGVQLAGTFAPGARMRGPITHKGYEHLTMDLVVDRMEPETLFSWRWHPYAVEPGQDYSTEEPTLVVFELKDVPEGTLLRVVESGFDKVPADRRELAYRSNEGGWTIQVENIARHVGQAS
jgi:uncharacterized protein YndB with AHSA1/START domain